MTEPRPHPLPAAAIDPSSAIELVVFAIKQRAAHGQLLGHGARVTASAPGLQRVVAGHIITLAAGAQVTEGDPPHLSGQLEATRIDAAALGLPPLALREGGSWDPDRALWPRWQGATPAWAQPIVAGGVRPMVEMEQVLPGFDPDDIASDPILQAQDAAAAGDRAAAREILSATLERDLRCIDAHAHLGNALLPSTPEWALRHYEVGVRIGEFSLAQQSDGVLPWAVTSNRPFLRCLHGYALCLWRLERWDEATAALQRLLYLNPADQQGMRFELPKVQAQEPWREEA